MLLISTPIDHKSIRQLITMLLKSDTATEIKKLNYVASYTLQEGKMVKVQEKVLAIYFDENKKEKLLSLLSKYTYSQLN